jgi:hypothetical protein
MKRQVLTKRQLSFGRRNLKRKEDVGKCGRDGVCRNGRGENTS